VGLELKVVKDKTKGVGMLTVFVFIFIDQLASTCLCFDRNRIDIGEVVFHVKVLLELPLSAEKDNVILDGDRLMRLNLDLLGMIKTIQKDARNSLQGILLVRA
jgi:hypothetical protein